MRCILFKAIQVIDDYSANIESWIAATLEIRNRTIL